jgi:hypothetical protein
MASAICTEYTPVRTRRGKVVHALAMVSVKPVCGKPRPRAGWIATDGQLNCLACMAKLVRMMTARARKVAAAERDAATP